MRPIEGTILTVVRWAAEAAEAARDGGAVTLVDLLDAGGRRRPPSRRPDP